MPFTDFKSVDFVTGDRSVIADLLRNAPFSCQRVCIIGDSQETAPTGAGYLWLEAMQAAAWRYFGPASETRVMPVTSFGGGSPTLQ